MNVQDFNTLLPILDELGITLHVNVKITTQEVQAACVKTLRGLRSQVCEDRLRHLRDDRARQYSLL